MSWLAESAAAGRRIKNFGISWSQPARLSQARAGLERLRHQHVADPEDATDLARAFAPLAQLPGVSDMAGRESRPTHEGGQLLVLDRGDLGSGRPWRLDYGELPPGSETKQHKMTEPARKAGLRVAWTVWRVALRQRSGRDSGPRAERPSVASLQRSVAEEIAEVHGPKHVATFAARSQSLWISCGRMRPARQPPLGHK